MQDQWTIYDGKMKSPLIFEVQDYFLKRSNYVRAFLPLHHHLPSHFPPPHPIVKKHKINQFKEQIADI